MLAFSAATFLCSRSLANSEQNSRCLRWEPLVPVEAAHGGHTEVGRQWANIVSTSFNDSRTQMCKRFDVERQYYDDATPNTFPMTQPLTA
jgi:hypothetical protein